MMCGRPNQVWTAEASSVDTVHTCPHLCPHLEMRFFPGFSDEVWTLSTLVHTCVHTCPHFKTPCFIGFFAHKLVKR